MKGFVGSGLQLKAADICKFGIYQSLNCAVIEKRQGFARSAAPNLPALEEQLSEVMREADRRGYIIVNSCMEQKYGTEFWRPALFAMLTAVQQGRVNAVMVQSLDRLSHDITILYRILRFLQNYSAVLITTETNLQYELYLTGLESRILARAARTRKRVPWEVAVDAD